MVELEIQRGEDGQSQVRLELTPEIASPLAVFTEQSIGRNMDIGVGGQLVNSAQIAVRSRARTSSWRFLMKRPKN